MLIVRAPVRVSFFGGGTDLHSYYSKYGGAVISASINKHFYVFMTEQPDNRVQLISSDLRVMQTLDDLHPEEVEGALRIPLAAIRYIGLNRGANIFLASEVPPGTGLGSSGAVSVCLVKALSVFTQRSFDPYSLAEAAYHVNSVMLGHPGGKQDEYGSAFGGLKNIEFRADGVTVHPLDLDPVLTRELESNILLFFLGNARESSLILNRMREDCQDDRSETVEALNAMKAMVREGIACIESGELHRFGELLHEAWTTKRRLAEGVSTPKIDALYARARGCGAVGGKVTGAGGGGFLMLYCEEDHRPAVRAAMREAGAREMLFNFDHDGVQVVHDDPFFGAGDAPEAQWKLVRFE